MALFFNRKKVGGDIAYYGLTDWWLNELTKDERNIIRNTYKPLGTTNLIDEGSISFSSQSKLSFLGTLSEWFKKNEYFYIGNKIYIEGEKHIDETPDILDKHFFFLNGIRLYYANRDLHPMALEKAIECCKLQISISEKAKKAFLKEYKNENLPQHTGYKQLAIIYEKQANFNEALKISKQALSEGWNVDDCKKRIEKLEKKINNK